MQEKFKVIVATIAFGMGINKQNVGYVIHDSMPQSMDRYIQEIGRAGRNGEPANAILFYDPKIVNSFNYFLQKNENQTTEERK